MSTTPAHTAPIWPVPTNAVGTAASPSRTGAFSTVRARWLPVWAIAGGVLVAAILFGIGLVGGPEVSDELFSAAAYLPVMAWVWYAVWRRAGADLRVLFRWPRLGTYWFVVFGMLVVQFVFSMGAATLTNLLFPSLDDSLAGVGQGNLLIALLGITILPPLVEETVFRGVLIERWTAKWRVGVAIIVSAVCFGILHADPVGAGVFGVIMSLLYLRTRSLWPGILVHFANNFFALVMMRVWAEEASAAAPVPSVSEALLSAGLLLAVSVPFVAWFIKVHWPERGSLTPYQEHEALSSLPPRTFGAVAWSGAPIRVRVEATAEHLIVSHPISPGSHLAVLPLERVAAAYPAVAPGGLAVVLLLKDGTWTSMQVAAGRASANVELADAISERAQLAQQRPAAELR
ncbi:MAG: type II CAAX endopeptidase family protein [Candidatus Nanopelagicales bacterium]